MLDRTASDEAGVAAGGAVSQAALFDNHYFQIRFVLLDIISQFPNNRLPPFCTLYPFADVFANIPVKGYQFGVNGFYGRSPLLFYEVNYIGKLLLKHNLKTGYIPWYLFKNNVMLNHIIFGKQTIVGINNILLCFGFHS